MELAVPMVSSDAQVDFSQERSIRELVLEEYDRGHASLRRYAGFLGLDSDSAQDIVHEAFVKLAEHLYSGGERANLRAWLYRVVHNLARNSQKRTDSAHESLDELTGFAEPAAKEASPEQNLLWVEKQRRVREALQKVSGAQRECLVLRGQGLKYREIAETVGLSISTVSEHVQRGLQAIRELL